MLRSLSRTASRSAASIARPAAVSTLSLLAASHGSISSHAQLSAAFSSSSLPAVSSSSSALSQQQSQQQQDPHAEPAFRVRLRAAQESLRPNQTEIEMTPELLESVVAGMLVIFARAIDNDEYNGVRTFASHMREPLLRAVEPRIRRAVQSNILKDATHAEAFIFSTLTAEAPKLAKTHEEAIAVLWPFAPRIGEVVELDNIRGTSVVSQRVYTDSRGDMTLPPEDRERVLTVTYDCLHPALKDKCLVAKYPFDPDFGFATYTNDAARVQRALAARRALSKAGQTRLIDAPAAGSSRARPSTASSSGVTADETAAMHAPLPRVLGQATPEEMRRAAEAATSTSVENVLAAITKDASAGRGVLAGARDDAAEASGPGSAGAAAAADHSHDDSGAFAGARHVMSQDEYYRSVFASHMRGDVSQAAEEDASNALAAALAATASSDYGSVNEEMVTEFTGRSASNPADASPAAEARRRQAAAAAEASAKRAQGRTTEDATRAAGDAAFDELEKIFKNKPNPLTLPDDADLLATYPDANMKAVEKLGRLWEDMAGDLAEAARKEKRGVHEAQAGVKGAMHAPLEVVEAAEKVSAKEAAAKSAAAAAGKDPSAVREGSKTKRKVMACVAAMGQEQLSPAHLIAIFRWVTTGGARAPTPEEAAAGKRHVPGAGAVSMEELEDMPEMPLSMELAAEAEATRMQAIARGEPDPADEEEEMSDSEIAGEIDELLRESDRSQSTVRVRDAVLQQRAGAKAAYSAAAAAAAQNPKNETLAAAASAAKEQIKRTPLAELLDGAPLYRIEDMEGFPAELLEGNRAELNVGTNKEKRRPRLPWVDAKQRQVKKRGGRR